MDPADLQDLLDWIRGRTANGQVMRDGPGVLVMGQPVFTGPAGSNDRNLADYPQFQELVRALASVDKTVLILTGDVHYGRVATCSVSGAAAIHEVIASPAALVHWIARGSGDPPPDKFANTLRTNQIYNTGGGLRNTHLVTVDFHQVASVVKVNIKYWFVRDRNRLLGPHDGHDTNPVSLPEISLA